MRKNDGGQAFPTWAPSDIAMFDAEIKETQETCCHGNCAQGDACPLYRSSEEEQDAAVRELSWKWADLVIGAIGLGCLVAAIASATGVLG